MRALINTAVLLTLASTAYAGDSNPTQFTNFNGYTYFVAESIAHGRELWRTFGVAESTELVWEFEDGPDSGIPRGRNKLFVFDDKLFVALENGIYASEDGLSFSLAVDVEIITSPINPSIQRSTFISDARIYFSGYDEIHETQVWSTDGTQAGTVRLSDIEPFGGMLYWNIREIAATNGIVVFTRELPQFNGDDVLFATTDAGTPSIQIYPSMGNGHAGGFTVAGDRIFFAGTPSGPSGASRAILSYNTTSSELEGWASPRFNFNYALAGGLIFTGGTNSGGSDELNVCNSPGDCIEIDVYPDGSSSPYFLTAWDDGVVFSAFRGDTGREVFASNGTEIGTGLVTEIVTGPDGSDPEEFAPLGSALFFSADNGVLGREPYVATDIAGGHLLLDDIYDGGDSNPREFTPVITPFGSPTEFVIFSATDETVGREPYFTGGFFGPTELLLDINNPADIDVDGVLNETDNCTERQNPDQNDSNADGYGNACDADLDDSGYVNYADLALFSNAFGTSDPDADFDGDGFVGFSDLDVFRNLFAKPPGPSGLAD